VMRIILYTHSLVSDWNHGNAHFLRGLLSELEARGHSTLALEPEMMLLDEPTAGMAHGDVDRIVDLIKRIRKGRTILMVEHNLSVVEGLCDKITVLTRGKVLAEGDYDTVSKNPEVIAAYLGTVDA